jgi:hypothetical protein
MDEIVTNQYEYKRGFGKGVHAAIMGLYDLVVDRLSKDTLSLDDVVLDDVVLDNYKRLSELMKGKGIADANP